MMADTVQASLDDSLVILGEGEYRFRVMPSWAKLPDGWDFRDVASVTVDRHDNVYVFNRGAHPMIVFDRDGNFLRSWGDDIFDHPRPRPPHGAG